MYYIPQTNSCAHSAAQSYETYSKILDRWSKIELPTKEDEYRIKPRKLSPNAKEIMSIIKTIVAKGKIVNYAFFIKKLDKCQVQIRRYFKELAVAGVCLVKFVQVGIVNGRRTYNFLEFNLTDKGSQELGVVIHRDEHLSRTKMSTPYIDKELTIRENNIDLAKSTFLKDSKDKKKTPISDIPDLTPEDASELNHLAGREFNLRFQQELLDKLKKEKPGNAFFTKRMFKKYFATVLANEKRQAFEVNNNSFKLKVNITAEERSVKMQEDYLADVENSFIPGKTEHLKRKIAGRFDRIFAYNFLRNFVNLYEHEEFVEIDLSNGGMAITDYQRELLLQECQAVFGDHIGFLIING